MKLLLEAGGGALVNTPSKRGLIPLVHATSINCSETMVLLIDAGSALSSPKWKIVAEKAVHASEECLESALSHREDFGAAFDIIVIAMKDRRLKLQALAQQKLPGSVFDRLAIPSATILEGAHLDSLMKALEQHKIHVPQELRPGDPRGTVYHYITRCYPFLKELDIMAQRVFDSGYCCVDELNSSGISPMACISPHWLSMASDSLQYAQWLESKGANLKQIMTCSPIGATSAHQLAFNGGIAIGYDEKNSPPSLDASQETSIRKAHFLHCIRKLDTYPSGFLYNLLLTEACDGCSCSCSPVGCTPFTYFMKAVNTCYWSTPPYAAPDEVQEWVVEWIDRRENGITLLSDDSSSSALVDQIFHYLTHQRLGLSHLCCQWSAETASGQAKIIPHNAQHFKVPDCQYVRDEEALLITKHKELTVEFMEQYQQQNIPLSEFVKGYWQERIDQVLSDEDFAAERILDNVRHCGVALSWG